MEPNSVPTPKLLDLVEPNRWQSLQEHFANVLGISIRTISPARELVVSPSWPASFPVDQAIQTLQIGNELESLLPSNKSVQNPTSLTTTLGITYAIVPIKYTAEQVIAYFIVGPVMVGPRENEMQFRQRVVRMGLDAEAIWSLVIALKLYSFGGIRSVISLMEEVGTSLVQFAFQAKQLNAILPSATKVDGVMVKYYTERVLRSLLDAATLATRADGGSVITGETDSDDFKIRVAEGLSDEVIEKTCIKRQEGIAGMAMAQRNILLVDDQISDTKMRSQMARPNLVSSLVAPLIADAKQEPIGVLNLRTSNPQRRFTGEHVELLRRLLDLAGAALSGLRVALSSRPSSSKPS